MIQRISLVEEQSEEFLKQHTTGLTRRSYPDSAITGEFSLLQDQEAPDLYGMIDAAYILYIIGKLAERTDRESRQVWAKRILACQDEQGWFSRRNLRGHSSEHATAYAIGALKLLEVEPDEHYLDQVRPISSLKPLLTEYTTFTCWIRRLDFRLTPRDILSRKLGWHYIWRGSHVGGGIAAIVGMTEHLLNLWWPEVDVPQWFDWYFDWLDRHANPNSGYWQLAFWNRLVRKPTVIDMGGAVHFFWIYEALERPFPYPEAVLASTLSLQREDGLYKDHPFCIDLDGDFCVLRAFLQLPESKQRRYQERVQQSLEASFGGVVRALTDQPLEQIYADSHGLPGALAALTECAKLPGFKHAGSLHGWQHPLDRVWWL